MLGPSRPQFVYYFFSFLQVILLLIWVKDD